MTQSIGGSTTYTVTVPSLIDDADIVEALTIYHYGSTTIPANSGAVSAGVAGYLKTIQNDTNGRIPNNVATAKGDVLVGVAADQVEVLALPANDGLEYVLVADHGGAKGVTWVTSSKEEERIAHIMGVF